MKGKRGPREKKSWVYKLVIINVDNIMYCKPCKEKGIDKELKCGGLNKNTTNIIRHLEAQHPVEALATKKLNEIESEKKKEAVKKMQITQKFTNLK